MIRSFATFCPLPQKYYSLLEEQMNCVLLEISRFNSEEKRGYFFLNPTHIISIRRLEGVPHLFSDLEQYISDGFFVAGCFGYECGCHFEEITPSVTSFPSLNETECSTLLPWGADFSPESSAGIFLKHARMPRKGYCSRKI